MTPRTQAIASLNVFQYRMGMGRPEVLKKLIELRQLELLTHPHYADETCPSMVYAHDILNQHYYEISPGHWKLNSNLEPK